MNNKYHEALSDYLHNFSEPPFVDNKGGLGVYGRFFLYWILKKVSPSTVIESGVWKGGSTWLIEKCLPQSTLICIDPHALQYSKNDPEWFKYQSSSAVYSDIDFIQQDFSQIVDKENCLLFLDDHQDHLPRLQHCQKIGIKHVILDDNYKCTTGSHLTLYCHQRSLVPEPLDIEIKEQISFNDFLGSISINSDEEKPFNSNMTYIKL